MFGNSLLLVLTPIFIWGMVKLLKNSDDVWGWIILLYSVSFFLISSGYGLIRLINNPDHAFPGILLLIFSITITIIMVSKRKPHHFT